MVCMNYTGKTRVVNQKDLETSPTGFGATPPEDWKSVLTSEVNLEGSRGSGIPSLPLINAPPPGALFN